MDKPERDHDYQDEIARRAQERFQERGGQHGDDQADWFESEREILHRRGGPQAAEDTPDAGGPAQRRERG